MAKSPESISAQCTPCIVFVKPDRANLTSQGIPPLWWMYEAKLPYKRIAPDATCGEKHRKVLTMVKRLAGLFLLFLLTLSVATGAVAQQRQADPAVVAACTGDAQRLCGKVEPGGGRIAQCLRSHWAQVSPGCSEAVRASRQHSPAR